MIKHKDTNLKQHIYWVAGADVKKGNLVISNSGAKPATAALASQIAIGLALEDAASGAKAKLYPLTGTVLVIDVLQTGTKTTFTDADLGTDYDFVVTSTDFALDPDDTTNANMTLVGYDNTLHTADVMLKNTLILMG